MTAYWDAIRHEVQEASRLPNDAFVEAVMAIETRVIRIVSLTTGDREFPDDLRDKIQGIIAVHALRFDGNPSIWDRTDAIETPVDPQHDPIEPIVSPQLAALHEQLRTQARAKEWLLIMRYSRLLEDLHTAFHQVAAYRAPNRYDSRFTDDPTCFLAAREAALGKELS